MKRKIHEAVNSIVGSMCVSGTLPNRERFDNNGEYHVHETKKKIMMNFVELLMEKDIIETHHLPAQTQTHYQANLYVFDPKDFKKLELKLFEIVVEEISNNNFKSKFDK